MTRRPYSRASSLVRRGLEADATSPPVTEVYGDADVVTVVYPPDADVDHPHREQLAACVAVLAWLADRGLAPDLVRGVADAQDAAPPLVWLLPRAWAVAYVEGRLDHADAPPPTVTTPDGRTGFDLTKTRPITTHGSRNCSS